MVNSGIGEFIVLLVLGLFLKWKSSPGATDEQLEKTVYQKYNMNWRDLKGGKSN